MNLTHRAHPRLRFALPGNEEKEFRQTATRVASQTPLADPGQWNHERADHDRPERREPAGDAQFGTCSDLDLNGSLQLQLRLENVSGDVTFGFDFTDDVYGSCAATAAVSGAAASTAGRSRSAAGPGLRPRVPRQLRARSQVAARQPAAAAECRRVLQQVRGHPGPADARNAQVQISRTRPRPRSTVFGSILEAQPGRRVADPWLARPDAQRVRRLVRRLRRL